MAIPSYFGSCSICGYSGFFEKNASSFREGYQCCSCKASLRYQGQAGAIISEYGADHAFSLQELIDEGYFQSFSIYEPGVAGPFRELFSNVLDYTNSFYWNDVEPGHIRDGLECQSLEKLTYYDDRFDLIISSDILEHVRKPWDAFSEIFRVLKPGGCHIFSIPLHLPMPSVSKYRVDTSTKDDIFIEEPRYHGDGRGGKSLVYTDFGADMLNKLTDMGYEVICHTLPNDHVEVKKLVTFITKKPLSNSA